MKPMYLVQLVHSLDDFPVYQSDSKPKALRFAKRVKPKLTKRLRDLFCQVGSDPVKVRIVTFNAQGQPAKVEIVKDFII